MKYNPILLGILAFLSFSASAEAASISLGQAQRFSVLGGSTVTNTGPSIITGDLGVSPGTAVTGFPPGLVVSGTINPSSVVQAQQDNAYAYGLLRDLSSTQSLTGQNLGGLTLNSGVYDFLSSAQLTGTLTLNNSVDPNAVFVFNIGSTLTTASDSIVRFSDGSNNPNVFFRVGSSATLGNGTQFQGNILAATSITLNDGATIQCGRALAQSGAVTLNNNSVSTACTPPLTSVPIPGTTPGTMPVPTPVPTPALLPGLLGLGLSLWRRKTGAMEGAS